MTDPTGPESPAVTAERAAYLEAAAVTQRLVERIRALEARAKALDPHQYGDCPGWREAEECRAEAWLLDQQRRAAFAAQARLAELANRSEAAAKKAAIARLDAATERMRIQPRFEWDDD